MAPYVILICIKVKCNSYFNYNPEESEDLFESRFGKFLKMLGNWGGSCGLAVKQADLVRKV